MTTTALDALVHSETFRTQSGELIFLVLQHPNRNRSLRITHTAGDSTVYHVCTISEADIEDFHRAYLRVANAVRPSSRQTHPRSHERWSSAEDDFVRNAIGSGNSPSQVATMLGRSKSAIVARINMLSLHPHRNTFPLYSDTRAAAAHASQVHPPEVQQRERAERRANPGPLYPS